MQCHWSQGLRPQAANRMLPQISKIPSIGIVWIEMLEKDEGHHWTKLKNLNFPNFFFFCSQNFNLVVVQYYFKIFLWNTFYLLDKYSPMSSSSSLNRVAESSFFPGLQRCGSAQRPPVEMVQFAPPAISWWHSIFWCWLPVYKILVSFERAVNLITFRVQVVVFSFKVQAFKSHQSFLIVDLHCILNVSTFTSMSINNRNSNFKEVSNRRLNYFSS